MRTLIQLFNKQNTQEDVPNEFFCPLSREIMNDPIINEFGHSYERGFYNKSVQQTTVDPITKKKVVYPPYTNYALRDAIDDYIKKNPWVYEYNLSKNYRDIIF